MTDRQLCEEQWNSPTLGSAVRRVKWKRERYYTRTDGAVIKLVVNRSRK
jgi:hypothetical protein